MLLEKNRWPQVKRFASALIAGVVGLVATVAIWHFELNSENRTFDLEYSQRAANQASVLQSGITDYLDKLYAVRALFVSSARPPTRSEFEDFSNSLLVNQTAILNIAWLPRVTLGERAEHESAAARDGIPDYHIRAIGADGALSLSPERDEYFPKFYSTEPRTSEAYGIDNNDGGAREQALAHIRDANVLSISPPLLLHIGNGDRHGFWAALPVYARGLPHETLEERRHNLLGFVQGVFQIGVMVDSIFAGIKSPVRLYFFAHNDALNVPPIYFMSHLGDDMIEARSRTELAAGPGRTFPLNFGDVQWTVVIVLQQAALAVAHRRSSIILACGLLLSGFLTSFLWAARRNADRLELTNNELQRQKILLDTALENMTQGLCMFDADGRVMLFNKRYANWMGLPPSSLKGLSLLELIRARKAAGEFAGDPEEFFDSVVSAAREGNSTTRIIETSSKRALRVIEQPMKLGGWVATSEDITDWREAQARISYMSRHDALTGLANRTQLVEKLESAFTDLQLREGGIAVYFIDLDLFKKVNDTLGHDAGDFLLKTIGRRLRSVIRVDDLAARVVGDEFVVVQTGAGSPEQIEDFARRLAAALSAPMKIGEPTITATASVGIALAPADGANPEELLKCAALALYKAKADGRNCIRFYMAKMDSELRQRFELERIIRNAVLHDRFELYYQPIFEIVSRHLIGFEALLRLPAEDGKLIPPLVFIPVAEELRLIDKIGAWVLREATRVAATWPANLTVAVNLSPAQFLAGSVSKVVIASLKESGLAAERLELEITETLLLGNSEAILAELQTLKAMGVAIVMDDFGTGYSSLSYLWRFPFDKIKIDRSFMKGFEDSDSCRDAETVVRTIIALGRELNMRVTVEGVETAAQAAFLATADGDQAQGFFFGRPVPASEVSTIIFQDFRRTHLAPSLAVNEPEADHFQASELSA